MEKEVKTEQVAQPEEKKEVSNEDIVSLAEKLAQEKMDKMAKNLKESFKKKLELEYEEKFKQLDSVKELADQSKEKLSVLEKQLVDSKKNEFKLKMALAGLNEEQQDIMLKLAGDNISSFDEVNLKAFGEINNAPLNLGAPKEENVSELNEYELAIASYKK